MEQRSSDQSRDWQIVSSVGNIEILFKYKLLACSDIFRWQG